MSTHKVKVKQVVSYGGHNLAASGSVNLTLKASYSELVNTVGLMQMLNNDIDVRAKIPSEKAKKLGTFRIKDIKIDGDGESIIKLNGLDCYVELDNLNDLILKDSDVKEFTVLMLAEIEDEDEGEE